MFRHVLAAAAIALLAVASPAHHASASDRTPLDEAETYINTLGNKALEILSNKNISLEERKQAVRELLRANIDIERIGSFVVGSAWRTADEKQRKDYMDVFGEFVVRTYGERLSTYNDQSFKVVGTAPIGSKDALVSTEILQRDADPIKAGWRVSTTPNGYKILDVIVEGVSMAATQRSDFESVIRRDGLDGLIAQLHQKVDQLSNGN